MPEKYKKTARYCPKGKTGKWAHPEIPILGLIQTGNGYKKWLEMWVGPVASHPKRGLPRSEICVLGLSLVNQHSNLSK
jgi:hypothetical protein